MADLRARALAAAAEIEQHQAELAAEQAARSLNRYRQELTKELALLTDDPFEITFADDGSARCTIDGLHFAYSGNGLHLVLPCAAGKHSQWHRVYDIASIGYHLNNGGGTFCECCHSERQEATHAKAPVLPTLESRLLEALRELVNDCIAESGGTDA